MVNTTTKTKTKNPSYLGGLNPNGTINATAKVLRAEVNIARVKASNGKTVAYVINNKIGTTTDIKYLLKLKAITIS